MMASLEVIGAIKQMIGQAGCEIRRIYLFYSTELNIIKSGSGGK
jgi:hypothetical protein